jgi:CRISPR-associated endonuclease Cas1
MKPSLRPVFYWADAAEANFLVRKKQYEFSKEDISIARILVCNKIANQELLLRKTKKQDELSISAIDNCKLLRIQALHSTEYNELMGIEGHVAKIYFAAYFQNFEWKGRRPRIKGDYINSILDIGYTYLFNFMECFIRMFGFDLYVGVYHRLWFKRKSLICDLLEPFRCIIDRTVRTSINRKQFNKSDFSLYKGEYRLKPEKNKDYSIVFFDALIPYKNDIFKYVQQYYRCFMNNRSSEQYPQFTI